MVQTYTSSEKVDIVNNGTQLSNAMLFIGLLPSVHVCFVQKKLKLTEYGGDKLTTACMYKIYIDLACMYKNY